MLQNSDDSFCTVPSVTLCWSPLCGLKLWILCDPVLADNFEILGPFDLGWRMLMLTLFSQHCCQSTTAPTTKQNLSSSTIAWFVNDDSPPKDNACMTIQRLVNDNILPNTCMQLWHTQWWTRMLLIITMQFGHAAQRYRLQFGQRRHQWVLVVPVVQLSHVATCGCVAACGSVAGAAPGRPDISPVDSSNHAGEWNEDWRQCCDSCSARFSEIVLQKIHVNQSHFMLGNDVTTNSNNCNSCFESGYQYFWPNHGYQYYWPKPAINIFERTTIPKLLTGQASQDLRPS